MSTTVQIVFGFILLAFAIFLVIAVLMQEGKSYGLSGAISGGADTMFGKTRGKKVSEMLSKVTTIIAIIFAVMVIILTTVNRNEVDPDIDTINADPVEETTAAETATAAETTAEAVAETAVETAAETPAA
ncbi:MAG: preprotein translocase subunit SecG [Clostridia bacterium]|nr:preprotein translocase subunit SecG [Clostridia bacterium]